MAGVSVNRLTNANIYVGGSSKLGMAEEVQLPNIKHIMSEHKALGMVGKFEFFSGIDKMEGKIKWNSFYPDILKTFANPTQAVSIMVRGNLETWESAGKTGEVAAVVYITLTSKNFPTGTYKQHDNVEAETDFTCTYVKMEIDGKVVAEIDVLANIYKVDGVDILANYRANLGI